MQQTKYYSRTIQQQEATICSNNKITIGIAKRCQSRLYKGGTGRQDEQVLVRDRGSGDKEVMLMTALLTTI